MRNFKFITAFILISVIGFQNRVLSQIPQYEWARQIASAGNEIAVKSAVDNSGNVYCGGNFLGSLIIGGDTLNSVNGAYDAIVIKFDTSGQYLWSLCSEGIGGEQTLTGLAVDSLGNVFISGYFTSDTVKFGAFQLLNSSHGFLDVFIVKLDASGNVLWARSAGGMHDEKAYAIAVDKAGNSVVTGYFRSPFAFFGNDTLFGNNYRETFVAKYDPNGIVVWLTHFGSVYDDAGNAIVVDDWGNVIVGGWYSQASANIGSYVLTNSGGNDAFLAKLDSNGTVLWAKRAGGVLDETILALTSDIDKNIIVAGTFQSTTISLGGITMNNSGGYDIFLVKTDPNGNAFWAVVPQSGGAESPSSLVTDKYGNIFMSGSMSFSTLMVGALTIYNTQSGSTDAFLVKFDENGSAIWAINPQGINNDYAYSVSLDTVGGAYLYGYCYDSDIAFNSAGSFTSLGGADMFLCKISECYPSGDAGTINGPSTVCQGQDSVIYSVSPIPNATTYHWLLPSGAIGASNTTEIMVNFNPTAVTGPISVFGESSCGSGFSSSLTLNVENMAPTPSITQIADSLVSNWSYGNQWYNQDGLIPGAVDRFFNVVNNGYYYVIITLQNCPSFPSNVVAIFDAGITENIEKIISITPNPFSDNITITAKEKSPKRVSVFNSVGQIVANVVFNETIVLKTNLWDAGIYAIVVETESSINCEVLIKSKSN